MPEISQEELDAFKGGAAKLEELEGKFKGVDSTLKRLEGENTKLKSRSQDAEQKLSDFEKEKLENNGDIQKRLDMEIEDNIKLKASIADKTEKSLTSKLRSSIVENFPTLQKGAVDIMLGLKEHKSLLKIDKETESIEGIKEFGEAVSKSHPYLFSMKKLKDTDNNPPGNEDFNDDDLSEDQRYRKELAAAKNQTDFDKVRKKFKRG